MPILKKEVIFIKFDECRKKRMGIQYYGQEMDFDTAKKNIKKCNKLIDDILLLIPKL